MCNKATTFESLKVSKQMTLKLQYFVNNRRNTVIYCHLKYCNLKHFIFGLMLTHLVMWNQLKLFAKNELQKCLI